MSTQPHHEPDCVERAEPSVELVIAGNARDLGDGFRVRRVLPSVARRTVGPFIFFDHMGPVALPEGQGMDVRPHPHIGLATVTYLFEGEILHRDTLGSEQLIQPGAVNWMTAGRGIAHSERSPSLERVHGAKLHGLQLWVALPLEQEEIAPSFRHHPAATIPEIEQAGAQLRVVAGSAYGQSSPVETLSPLFYVEARFERGVRLMLPEDYAERAAYVLDGAIRVDGEARGPNGMLVFRAGVEVCIEALEASRVMLLGGAPLDGERHVYWNFVSSSRARIEQAKADYREGKFGKVPGDEQEFIPLPPDVGRPR